MCRVGLSKGSLVVKSQSVKTDKGYSEILMPLIRAILEECRLSIQSLTGFLVCTGPGNYTSLRVAISTARGLALATGKPACGISLFELLSINKKKVLVLVEGPEKKIYTQNFSRGFQVDEPRLMTIEEIKKTKQFFGSHIIGFQAETVSELIESKSYFECTDPSFKKFIPIGLSKLEKKCPKPAPIYISK